MCGQESTLSMALPHSRQTRQACLAPRQGLPNGFPVGAPCASPRQSTPDTESAQPRACTEKPPSLAPRLLGTARLAFKPVLETALGNALLRSTVQGWWACAARPCGLRRDGATEKNKRETTQGRKHHTMGEGGRGRTGHHHSCQDPPLALLVSLQNQPEPQWLEG